MSIIKVTPDDVEKFTIVTTPRREYVSSSSGVTGSVKVFPRASSNQKETAYSSTFVDTGRVTDDNFDTAYSSLVASARTDRALSNAITGTMSSYFDIVTAAAARRTADLNVERFTPTTKLSVYSVSKSNIKDMLMPYYRASYPEATWSYVNYNSLNFFVTSSAGYSFPTGSVLLYPNIEDASITYPIGQHSGSYCLSGAFSFDFHINPRYRTDGIDPGHFKAGTIFHLSSSYAVSLLTGSARDINGNINGYRLMLQLSHSADVPPSTAVPGIYPNDLTFVSDDNSLSWNNWHHVVVRWGTNTVNDGTGSFIVDGVERGTFIIPSASVGLTSSAKKPEVLCIGNYYEGSNAGVDSQSYFFSEDLARYDGVEQLTSLTSLSHEGPQHFAFRHPLKAEVHDLVIHRKYLSNSEIYSASLAGIGVPSKQVAFYSPPFFVEETAVRTTSVAASSDPAKAGDRGGILQTPFFAIDGTTDDPFNVAMAFGVAGHYINLENYVKDFSTDRFPRLLSLTASIISETTSARSANDFLYDDPAVAKRNLTIMPCDDGTFDPNYAVLLQEDLRNKYVDQLGTNRIDYVNLDNLLSADSLKATGLTTGDPDSPVQSDFSKELIGPDPEQPGVSIGTSMVNYIAAVQSAVDDSTFERGVQRGKPLTIYQRIQDPSSDQVTIFNISNLFYGKKILPMSFMLRDAALSGSQGHIGVTLRDDGRGSLYRTDSVTQPATFNSVGNIFYDEGIVVVKNPHLYFFGKNQFEMSFRGVNNVYSTKYEIVAPAGMLNSSSNPSYLENYEQLRASERVGETAEFVYISGMNLHDENMNVVARARLAQPIIKRQDDKILFKLALDW